MPSTRSKTRWIALSAVAIALTIVLILTLRFRTYHYAVVQPGVLYRCGFRQLADLSATVDRARPRTIISLVQGLELTTAPFDAEEDFCRQRHIQLLRIPIPRGQWPTADQVQQFLATVSDKQNQPVLVHCAEGVHRTGLLVAAFQLKTMDYDKATVQKAILDFNHSGRTVNSIMKFIDAFDPKTGTVVQQPPTTSPVPQEDVE